MGPGANPPTIARTLAYLFGSGAMLLLATLALPGSAERDPARLAGIAGCAVIVAAFLIWRDERFPLATLKFVPALGTLLVGGVIYLAGADSAGPYALYLCWVVIVSACFFPLRVTAVHGVLALAVYAAAAEASPGEMAAPLGLSLAMFAGTTVVVAVMMSGLNGQLNVMMERLEAAARTDPLTDLLNMRAFADAFDAELARTERSGDPVSLVVLDLDGFKAYNDRHGHPAGDRALQRLASVLEVSTRTVDQVARVGGEEFAIIAPECDQAGAVALAERLRRAIEAEFGRPGEALTASFGVACTTGGAMRPELASAADRALYQAKAAGRNRVVCAAASPHRTASLLATG